VPASAALPRLPGTRIHLGLVFALVALILVYLLVKRTFFGYEIGFIGANRDAARAGGINVTRTLIIMMLISGGLCGIAGMAEVTGLELRLKEEISLGYGFFAITAALLGRLNPPGIALGALVLSILIVGGQYVQRTMSLPSSFIDIITALVVLLLLVGWYASQYRLEILRE
jgi:general nucleoside transport system permease protein